ncbi:hypothetical protein GCM10011396_50370 [Undibacterium terreum]|uniref:Uncharacterized protein n=1 Tax=Undibacterium terreum TaxID=1224302 RepID=A0A916XRG3_9BURK|nr:hypothetical protein GCM10011396_50370 [Undibacterium terreum]
MRQQGCQIALRAGRKKQRRLEAELLRHYMLKAMDGRILIINIIPDWGIQHRRAHRGARFGNGITAKIYSRHGGFQHDSK